MKPIQIYYKVWLKLSRKYLNHFALKYRSVKNFKIPVLYKHTSILENIQNYSIFNEKIDLSQIDWKMRCEDALFQYHLHYHDFLSNLEEKSGLRVILDWIEKNPPSNSIAWDPYTISLRVVNWIKFISRYHLINQVVIDSLLLQGIWLYYQREYHLLSNHFFKNIVALLYLGYIFENKKWYQWAFRNFEKQLEEQLTNEGYHFEFSPTYHAIFVKDLLDIYNLIVNNDTPFKKRMVSKLELAISKSLFWLQYFSYSGSYLPINDVNYQDVSRPNELIRIAEELEIQPVQKLVSSCYPVLENKNLKLMVFCAPFNPSYNPSHSHADILSILLWFRGKPIVIDTGNFTYKESAERSYSRSTRAHNTIEINSKDQAEMWKAFRVGDRSIISEKEIADISISCEYHFHDISHQRKVKKQDDEFLICDTIIGKGTHSFKMYYHFSPECSVHRTERKIIIDDQIVILVPDERITVEKTLFFPEMYQRKEKNTIVISGTFVDTKMLETRIYLQ